MQTQSSLKTYRNSMHSARVVQTFLCVYPCIFALRLHLPVISACRETILFNGVGAPYLASIARPSKALAINRARLLNQRIMMGQFSKYLTLRSQRGLFYFALSITRCEKRRLPWMFRHGSYLCVTLFEGESRK